MTQPLIRCEHLEVSFGQKLVLDLPQLALFPASSTVLSGKNGSGKTTLLKILAGLLDPDHMTIYFQGTRLSQREARRRLRNNVVYLHQHPYMFDGRVADNVAYGLKRAGGASVRVRSKVRRALEWCGLEHLSRQNARSLSGGERQRVALARAWVIKPRVLLLDEPTSNMDEQARAQTYFLIRRMVSEGMCVFMSSHEQQTLAQFGDRRLILEQGNAREVAREPAAANEAPRRKRKSEDS